MKTHTTLAIFFVFLLSTLPVAASHFMGFELSYEHLGGCTYRIYQTHYIGCQGTATSFYIPYNPLYSAAPIPLNFSGTGCSISPISLNWTLYDVKEASNLCPSTITNCTAPNMPIYGIASFYFFTDVSLCSLSCPEVVVSFSTCCRNYGITSGSGGDGLYQSIKIPLNISNSAPRFEHPPVFYISSGQSMNVMQTAYDKEGDSLVYSLAAPMQSSTLSISYNPGYSPQNPLGSNGNVSIDAQTGLLSINTVPGGIVTATIGIKVEEFRNGVSLGSVIRDYLCYVFNGGTVVSTNEQPTISMVNAVGVGPQTSPYELKTDASHPISFDLIVNDPDLGQALTYTSNIPFQFPGAILSSSGNTSPMIISFSWNPDSSQRGKRLPLVIEVMDDFCLTNCKAIAITTIEVDSNYIAGNITPSDCTIPTGAIDVSVGGGYPPYTYLWSTGDTTQDLTNIFSGIYTLMITDSIGTVWQADTFYVNALNISGTFSFTTPSCGVADGSIAIDVMGGVPPYTYTWTNGQFTDSIHSLTIGGYAVNVYDSLGCLFHDAMMLAYSPLDSCFSKIEGDVYIDLNGNCQYDALEPLMPYTLIDVTPGGAIYTDYSGHFTHFVTDTGTYTLNIYPSMLSTTPCLSNPSQLTTYVPFLGVDTLYNDFALELLPDLSVSITAMGQAVLGFAQTRSIQCKNMTTSNISTTLTYQHDSLFLSPTFFPPPQFYDPTTRTATWQIVNMPSISSSFFSATGTVSTLANIGNLVSNNAYLSPIIGEIDTLNNRDSVEMMIVGAYDPNIKTVSPVGITSHGLIPSNTDAFTYTIHFQNTGNYPASFVIIRDTMKVQKVDIFSIDILEVSHNCQITIENDSIVVFSFYNIQLPDSTSNEPASHGHVTYRIHLMPNLPLHTEITNQAAIYFDFNPPIFTAHTVNTLYEPMQVSLSYPNWVCQDDSVTAIVTQGRAPYTFHWSNGSQTVNASGISSILAPVASPNASVTLSDYYQASITHNFQLPLPPPANAAFTYFSSGNTFGFVANQFGLPYYHWDFGNGQTSNNSSAQTTYPQLGLYTVTLICTNACGISDTFSQNITVSSVSIPQESVVQISPNPASDVVVFKILGENTSNSSVSIVDLQGKTLIESAPFHESCAISVANLSEGMYFWVLKGSAESRGVLWIKK